MATNDKLEEYKVLTLKFDESDEESSAHSVFLKKYRSDHGSEKKSADKPVGKTLTVLNIPPYSTEESIARVFSVAGEVEKVTLIDSYSNELNSKYQVKSLFFNDALPFKFLVGFVVYKKSESLDLIFRVKQLPPLKAEARPATGIAKWTEDYNKRIVDSADMQTEIDEYMKHFDKIKKAMEMQANEGDDDGWVTVGKRGYNAGFKQKESVINRLEQKIQNQNKKTKNLSNFYSFELRDSKKQQLIDLRKKFEDDKLKMNVMRQNRKFKPYQ